MFQEFKTFINQGNVMDLAIGVIIGGAFGKIVTALVDNIIMPIIGAILGGFNFESLAITVGNATIKYGAFIQATFNFLVIAFVIFMIVKQINKMKAQAAPAAPAGPTQEELLTQIRDLLKK